MLAFFRSLIGSRVGALIGLVFLVLIALAFAGADVGGMRSGSLIGGERVATVGDARITTGELEKTMRTAFESEHQQTPTLTMKDFLAQGALDDVLNGLIDRDATEQWGNKYGIGLSDRLIDSEIAKLPAFQGPDGKFSQQAYTQLLAQRGLTDKMVRDDIGKGLVARQVFAAGQIGTVMPQGVAMRYAALFKEKRDGSALVIPAAEFAPKTPASDQQVAAWYKANPGRYARPEHRTLRYAIIDDSAVKSAPVPGESEIAARYRRDAALYAPSETRSVTQVIVPTEAAAHALADEAAKGKTLEAAAASKGLAPSKLADQTHAALAGTTSRALSDAVFATSEGKLVAPTKGALGWVVARVDAIHKNPGKSPAEAHAAIATALATEKRHAALTELGTRIGEQLENGTSLSDVAKANGLVLVTSDPLQADGTVVGKPGVKVSDDLKPLLQTAFSMEREGQPQIAAIAQGTKYVAYDVGTITAAAPAPLAEIKEQVARDYALDQGARAAGVIADKVLAGLNKKQPIDVAARAAGLVQPHIQPLAITRQQLAAMQQGAPAPLSMLFDMTEGTARKIEAGNGSAWLIISLAHIEKVPVDPNDPLVSGAARQLGQVLAREYEDELRVAITREIGAKRNETGIHNVRTQLAGGQ